MSLRGKDFRCELDADVHDKLRQIANFEDKEVSAVGARLLEKAIVGEFHAFTILLDRARRSGKIRTDTD